MPATKTRQVRILSDVIRPHPKQSQLFDQTWKGAQTGDPEYLLFGGAAGGGKSYSLRWDAILFLMRVAKEYGVLNCRVGLFSKDYPSLHGRHVMAVKAFPEWMGVWKESSHDFILKPEYGGGILSLRNLDNAAKYGSEEFAAIFVEELTENTRDDFDELRARKRWPGVPYSPFVAACNPRHQGLGWVRKLWIEHDFSGDRDHSLTDKNFWFLQSTASDNESLPESYYETLSSLGPTLRKQLLEGNWYVSEDQALPEFSRFERDRLGEIVRDEDGEPKPWHRIPDYELPYQWKRVASHDWGYDSPGHHLWGAIDPMGGAVIYREKKFRRMDPQDIASTMLFLQGDEKILATYADPAIWQERKKSDLSQSQIDLLAENGKLLLSKYDQYREAGLMCTRANNARVAGLQRLHTLLKDRGDGVPYLRIMASCEILLTCLANIQKDPDNSEDVITEYLPDDDIRDDPIDALRYMIMGIPTKATQAPGASKPKRPWIY